MRLFECLAVYEAFSRIFLEKTDSILDEYCLHNRDLLI